VNANAKAGPLVVLSNAASVPPRAHARGKRESVAEPEAYKGKGADADGGLRAMLVALDANAESAVERRAPLASAVTEAVAGMPGVLILAARAGKAGSVGLKVSVAASVRVRKRGEL
jgi:hypothetical protein